MPADPAPRRTAERKQALQPSCRKRSSLPRLTISQVDWEGAFKAGDYQNVNSLRSIWNKFKRTKLAPGENTSKKRKADKEGAEDGDGEAPTKKRGKGAGKDKKTDTDGVDGAGKGDDEAEDKVKTEGEDAI